MSSMGHIDLCHIFQIRSAFYSALSGYCEFQPALANKQAAQLCPVVLYHMNETDPLIVPALWEAILWTITAIQVLPAQNVI